VALDSDNTHGRRRTAQPRQRQETGHLLQSEIPTPPYPDKGGLRVDYPGISTIVSGASHQTIQSEQKIWKGGSTESSPLLEQGDPAFQQEAATSVVIAQGSLLKSLSQGVAGFISRSNGYKTITMLDESPVDSPRGDRSEKKGPPADWDTDEESDVESDAKREAGASILEVNPVPSAPPLPAAQVELQIRRRPSRGPTRVGDDGIVLNVARSYLPALNVLTASQAEERQRKERDVERKSTRKERKDHGKKSKEEDDSAPYAWPNDGCDEVDGVPRLSEVSIGDTAGLDNASLLAMRTDPKLLSKMNAALTGAQRVSMQIAVARAHHTSFCNYVQKSTHKTILSPYVDLAIAGVDCVYVPVDEFGVYDLPRTGGRYDDERHRAATLAFDLVLPEIENFCTLSRGFTFRSGKAIYRRVGTPGTLGQPRLYQWGYAADLGGSGMSVYWKDHVLLADPRTGHVTHHDGTCHLRVTETFIPLAHLFNLVPDDKPIPQAHGEEEAVFVRCDSGDCWVPSALLARLNPQGAIVSEVDRKSMKVNSMRWLESKVPWLAKPSHERIALAAIQLSVLDPMGQDNVYVPFTRLAEHAARESATKYGRGWQAPLEVFYSMGLVSISNMIIRLLLIFGTLLWDQSVERGSATYAAYGLAVWVAGMYLLVLADYPDVPSGIRNTLRKSGGEVWARLMRTRTFARFTRIFFTSSMMVPLTDWYGGYIMNKQILAWRVLNFMWARSLTWAWYFTWDKTELCKGPTAALCGGGDMDAFEALKLLAASLALELVEPLARGAIATLTADASVIWALFSDVGNWVAGLGMRMVNVLKQSVSPK